MSSSNKPSNFGLSRADTGDFNISSFSEEVSKQYLANFLTSFFSIFLAGIILEYRLLGVEAVD
ncbi:hypothetical protein OUZ56_029538 [Daphnia magna]|uniref:Uncharacterized protein n=1 Tax=Daphnia magna TaxID=35525 RepID=A0ABR0B747_9CRUS|nr:hypothetical protein OUZ56_029538 [Daphnia magna]